MRKGFSMKNVLLSSLISVFIASGAWAQAGSETAGSGGASGGASAGASGGGAGAAAGAAAGGAAAGGAAAAGAAAATGALRKSDQGSADLPSAEAASQRGETTSFPAGGRTPECPVITCI